MATIETILARLDRSDPDACWEWPGARNDHGYGQARVDGKTQYVHRLVFTHLIGPIPKRMELDHIVCDNPPCANPRHVKVSTHRDNSRRANVKTVCLRGHPLTGPEAYIYVRPDNGRIQCRRCKTITERERMSRLAA